MNFAVAHKEPRCVFTSSNEVYGENRGDVEKIDENYCGYINSNTMRARYPESKRCGEAYNIADETSDITLKDLANIITDYVGKKVVFELPDQIEAAGYSKATKNSA